MCYIGLWFLFLRFLITLLLLFFLFLLERVLSHSYQLLYLHGLCKLLLIGIVLAVLYLLIFLLNELLQSIFQILELSLYWQTHQVDILHEQEDVYLMSKMSSYMNRKSSTINIICLIT